MDGGENFAPSIRLSETQSVLEPGHRARLGDHMGLSGTDEGVVAAWTFATTDWDVDRNDHNICARSAKLPTPAAVRDLQVIPEIRRVDLSWRVEDPQVLWRFRVQRRLSTADGEFTPIGTVERSQDSATERYAFTDTSVEASSPYEYRVELLLANGASRFSDVVSTVVPRAPQKLALRLLSSGAGTNERVQVELLSPIESQAELSIYDVRGTVVRRMETIRVEVGENTVSLDFKDDHGLRLPRGVFFLEVQVDGYRDVLKVVRTR
jgi:hypothetical protein